MQRYEHSPEWVPLPGRNAYAYWDWCHPCRHIQHYEEARATERQQQQSAAWDEWDDREACEIPVGYVIDEPPPWVE
jgi:hypothetical protein